MSKSGWGEQNIYTLRNIENGLFKRVTNPQRKEAKTVQILPINHAALFISAQVLLVIIFTKVQ